jgi:tRNA threonylcarbamoyladenosine biosynthesis protein TsaE
MGATGPYTSPTFIVMKHYPIEKLQSPIRNVFHIDTYRVEEQDILGLGWEEMIADEKNLLIVEWPERIAKIIPKNSTWINFEWLSENERKITFETK